MEGGESSPSNSVGFDPETDGSSSEEDSNGSARDSQILVYPRESRDQRIDKRLKTLQNLVPNGNNVDILTMLEETFCYVNFLQLQIKLLGSDDLWTYAPLAYNVKFPENIGTDSIEFTSSRI